MIRAKQVTGSLGNATVYQEGGTENPDLRLYTSFRAALAAAQALQPLDPVVIIDGSLGAPVVPSGVYPIGGGITLTAPWGQLPILSIQDGASFTGLTGFCGLRVSGGLALKSFATSAAVAQVGGRFFVFIDEESRLGTDATSTQPFFDASAPGANVLVFLSQWSTLSGGQASAPVFNLSGAGAAGLVFVDSSDTDFGPCIASNSLGGNASSWSVHLASSPSSQIILPQPSAGVEVIPALRRTQFFNVFVQLTNGTATVATGRNMTQATLLGVRLDTPNTAVGTPKATFDNAGNVTVTSFGPTGAQLITDQSTYLCIFAGAVG